MTIQVSDHFTYGKLIRFVIPSVAMMIFTSIYGLVDGYFVSNYTGSIPFAAINLIIPFLMIFSAVGFMIGTGGTALVAYKLGMGDTKQANAIFSMLIYLLIGVGAAVAVGGSIFLEDVSVLLGATEELLPYCVDYGRICLLAMGAFMLQTSFQSFLVAAGKPRLGFVVTLLAGAANMVLDYLLVGVFGFGIKGAAWATSISQYVGGVIPLIYFILPNGSMLRLGRAKLDLSSLVKVCSNGASEFLTNISVNVVAILYNFQLLKYVGEDGVTAYGVIMYVSFIFMAVFMGYSIGSAPLVSYHYGAADEREVKNLFRKSMIIIGVMSVGMLILAEAVVRPMALIYVSYDEGLMELTTRALKIYALSFLCMGFNIFGSGFFTALNDGRVSALISTLRTLFFEIGAVLLLPLLFRVDGIWGANVAAECGSLLMTIAFLIAKRKKYRY